MIYTIIIFILFIIFSIICIISVYRRELKNYNNGICKHCGTQLKHFTNDSQGNRGYICDNCENIIFVSYDIDKH